jgi:hypothetical protein
MNKKILFSILVSIGIIFVIVFFSGNVFDDQPIPEVNFIYSNVDSMQKILIAKNIVMSSPTVITDDTVGQYCTFFDDDGIQRFVQYCVTTALVDSDGEPLGNLNMGGNPISPSMALVMLEVSPDLDSKRDKIDFIFQTMIENLVCDCWNEQKPGGFESVSAWLDAAESKYSESSQTTLKSKIDGLAQKQLILEIITIDESYLWTLIVLK